MSTPEKFENLIINLPQKPGVYLMKDNAGRVIYVGKAINLRSRVRSYFYDSVTQPKILRLVSDIDDIEFIITDSELEALILEMNLIKRHRPKFNVRLKDDKRYPYIKVFWADDFPKVTVTRRMEKDGSRYFGPYTAAWAVHQTLDTLRRIFPYLTCNRQITCKDRRACLYYDIKLCSGPCIGAISKKAYRASIQGLMDFLDGRSNQVITRLKSNMLAEADVLNFEKAAQIRDQLDALQRIVEKQKVVSMAGVDQDVIAFARADGAACAQVYLVRAGRLIGREHFILDGVEDEECSTIISEFLKQFYDEAAYVPPEVLLPEQVAEAEVIESWLAKKRGTKVALQVPRRGKKKELVAMASENAIETLGLLRVQWEADKNRYVKALAELQKVLQLPAPPNRIECYDISTIQGSATTGSMVVFVQGVAWKRDYRQFNVRGMDSPDDFKSIEQVLTRRFDRWQSLQKLDSLKKNNTAWTLLPDLLIIDGGKGQLKTAENVLKKFNLQDRVPIAGLAKKREELYVPGRSDPIILPRRSQGLYLIQRIRDEAHRFAITHHRKRRGKAAFSSVLDTVPGVGPKRRSALIKAFGSAAKVQQASIDEIASVPGIPRHVAEAIKDLF